MFGHLFDFSYTRTTIEAIGFYVAWLLIVMLFSALASGLVGTFFIGGDNFSYGYSIGVRIGAVIAVIMSTLLSFQITRQKHILKKLSSIVLIILSGLIALFAGGLGGLIVPAYLSTCKAE